MITERTKIVSMVHVSNLLGTINPVETVIKRAHEVGALVLVDASQSAPHLPLDVTALGADFVAFTGHKMLGPTGIGVLWGRLPLLQELPPFLGGGEMIEIVTMEKSTFAQPPHKFEAGTPPIAEAVGLGAAVDYLTAIGMPAIAAHEHELTAYALDVLSSVDGVTIIGPPTADGPGGRDLVHPDGRPPTRRRPDPGRAGHRGAGRPPLRATGRAALRNSGDHPSVVLPVQHDRRGGRAGGGSGAGEEGLRMNLESMYQEIILDHYKNPHGRGLREPFDAESFQVNPTCGDEVTLRVAVADDKVTDVSYEGQGCSISQASTSVLTDLVTGRSVDGGMSTMDAFVEMVQGRGKVEPDEDVLEDGVAFAGVAKYPARVKCALLGWMAFKDAVSRTGERAGR